MALSYPLSLPATGIFAEMDIHANSAVGMSRSPFTAEEQVYAHPGEWLEADIVLPPMARTDAAAWITFLTALNGREGTFLMGDPMGTSPQGNWGGSPKVFGAHAVQVKTIAMDGFTASTGTVTGGDWIQRGSGTTTHLHMVTKSATADGSGLLTLEIWPRLRVALADNDTFVTADTVGIWRLASNRRSWSLREASSYGLRFSAEEALNA